MTATPALLAAAAGVAVGHAVLPDHWVPLAVLGRTRHYGLGRVARLSGAAGVAHVAVSLLLGAVIVVVGLQFRAAVENAQNFAIGGLLVATGLVFAGMELRGRGHHHPPTEPGQHHPNSHLPTDHGEPDHVGRPESGRAVGVGRVLVPFGAAASPDLTILPVFLAATAAGVLASVGALVVFSVVTIATIVGLTVSATFGGYQVQGAWLDRWGNTMTALVLLVVGALVLGGII